MVKVSIGTESVNLTPESGVRTWFRLRKECDKVPVLSKDAFSLLQATQQEGKHCSSHF